MDQRLFRIESIYAILGLAILLPAVAVLVAQSHGNFRSEAEEIRSQASVAASQQVLLSDARAHSDMNALRLLSRSAVFADLDVEAAIGRAQDALEIIQGWKAVILSDGATGGIVFNASRGLQERSGTFHTRLDGSLFGEFIDGVRRDGLHCPCIYFHVAIPGDAGHILTAVVDPLVYQGMLLQHLPEGTVAAIVDRDGKFLARSIDFPNRVGTPATSYVLDAVAEGGGGIYQGTTFEGLTNYTAYLTSDFTGWSSHIAMDTIVLDRPMLRANTTLFAGALIAIVASLLLFHAASRDIANKRRQELQVLELQRAEAVSEFTSTVVHDFRNVIAALQSGLSLIKRETRNDQIKSYVAMIESSIGRGTRLANQLLSFSHSDEAAIEVLDVAAILSDMEFLMSQAVGRQVTLTIHKPSNPLMVFANRDQLELALLNLVVNARDAIDGHGSVGIEAQASGGSVQIRVSDTGPGIAPEDRSKIFSAFHTTKANGTGLGLAQVAGMARNAGGNAFVETAAIGGACFVIELPKAIERTEADMGAIA